MTPPTDLVVRHSRGRPSLPEAEVKQRVFAAATELLASQGYAATTIEAIAKHAGVAKKTVYRFAENRDELIAGIVRSWTDALESDLQCEPSGDFGQRLEATLNAIARRVLSEQAVTMFRVLTGDFPGRDELLENYTRNGIQRGRQLLTEWLARQTDVNAVLCGNAGVSADLLLSMAIAEPLRQMALGVLPPLPDGDIQQRIKAVSMVWQMAAAGQAAGREA